MSFNDDVRLKAQSALKPYLGVGGNQSSVQVKNPILLLNYLYQRAVIPHPRYCVIPTAPNHPQHAVSCEIGDLQLIGTGKTNKVAKTNAAQQFLELLLQPVDISRMPSSLFGVVSSCSNGYPSDSVVNGDTARTSQSPVSFSSIKKRMQNSVKKKKKSKKSARPNGIAEPQMAQDEPVHVRSQSNLFPESIAESATDRQTVGKISAKKSKRSKRNTSLISKDTRQRNPFLTARVQSSCDAFFDPFFKQRPPNSNCAMIVEMKETESRDQNLESHDQSMETESRDQSMESRDQSTESCDQSTESRDQSTESRDQSMDQSVESESRPTTESKPNVVEENKNVFALLQKKTQKQLKLIPRFRIENIESGFRCDVRLGSYHASGEGRNKKMAKTLAAISLLDQINDTN